MPLLRKSKRNLAVFRDGFNDVYWMQSGHDDVPAFTEDAHVGWERERDARLERRWWPFRVQLLEASPLGRVVELARAQLGLQQRSQTKPAARGRKGAPFTLDHFAANRRMEDAVASANGIDVVRFLQPVPFYPPPPGTRTGFDAHAYPGLDHDPGFQPLTHALEGIEVPFVDATHYSDVTSLRIAERMADVVAPQVVSKQ